MEFKDIINTEKENLHLIYLYSFEHNIWKSFGASALLLNKLYPNIAYVEKDLFNNGGKIPIMTIDPMTLSHLLERVRPIEHTHERIVIKNPFVFGSNYNNV